MRLKTEKSRIAISENIAAEVLDEDLEKETLTPEQVREANLKVAREGSWLNALFQEHKLTVKDKQEILRRVMHQSRMQQAS